MRSPALRGPQSPSPAPSAGPRSVCPASTRTSVDPALPVRLASHTGALRPAPPQHAPPWFERVIFKISQPGFGLRRQSQSSRSSPQASPPSTPGLEESIAFALLSQDRADEQTTRGAYQSARRLSRTATEEYTALLNDMWLNLATGIKASCLTHALMSGHETLALWLETQGAEESYCYPATGHELALMR